MINFNKNSKTTNMIKWIIISILIIITLINYYYYINISFLWRIIITISLIAVIIGIIFSTKQGKTASSLIYEAKQETKKIIWPNLKETFNTTIIVIISAFIISLILWGLDNILIRFISFVTRLRI
ncbi:MAG: preprotein translocase subunit SecE [Buchnera aphidicola (Schlechtendalia peitan)]